MGYFLSSSLFDCKEPVTENNIIMMMHSRHDEEKSEWRGNFLTSHSVKNVEMELMDEWDEGMVLVVELNGKEEVS